MHSVLISHVNCLLTSRCLPVRTCRREDLGHRHVRGANLCCCGCGGQGSHAPFVSSQLPYQRRPPIMCLTASPPVPPSLSCVPLAVPLPASLFVFLPRPFLLIVCLHLSILSRFTKNLRLKRGYKPHQTRPRSCKKCACSTMTRCFTHTQGCHNLEQKRPCPWAVVSLVNVCD